MDKGVDKRGQQVDKTHSTYLLMINLENYEKLDDYTRGNLRVFTTLKPSSIEKGKAVLEQARHQVPEIYQDLLSRVIRKNSIYNDGIDDPLLHAQIYTAYAIANQIPEKWRGWRRSKKAEVYPWKNDLSDWISQNYGGHPYWYRTIIAIGISGAGFELDHEMYRPPGDNWFYDATRGAHRTVLKNITRIPE